MLKTQNIREEYICPYFSCLFTPSSHSTLRKGNLTASSVQTQFIPDRTMIFGKIAKCGFKAKNIDQETARQKQCPGYGYTCLRAFQINFLFQACQNIQHPYNIVYHIMPVHTADAFAIESINFCLVTTLVY